MILDTLHILSKFVLDYFVHRASNSKRKWDNSFFISDIDFNPSLKTCCKVGDCYVSHFRRMWERTLNSYFSWFSYRPSGFWEYGFMNHFQVASPDSLHTLLNIFIFEDKISKVVPKLLSTLTCIGHIMNPVCFNSDHTSCL